MLNRHVVVMKIGTHFVGVFKNVAEFTVHAWFFAAISMWQFAHGLIGLITQH